MYTPNVPSFPSFENRVLGVVPEPGRMDELHLYHGSRCNRACAFCCVNGAPAGDHIPFTDAVLAAAVAVVARQGSLKIYGGEPTLDEPNLRWTVARLRAFGFEGAITIFSNGIRTRALLDLMAADPRVRVVLNYAIATGKGERPIPKRSLTRLCEYDATHPGQIFLSHDFIVAVGRQDEERQAPPDAALPCFRCWPTLTSIGTFHACPFAVEYQSPHYTLGDIDTPPDIVRARFARFLGWVNTVLNPEAARQGRGACALCTGPDLPAFPQPDETLITVRYRPRHEGGGAGRDTVLEGTACRN